MTIKTLILFCAFVTIFNQITIAQTVTLTSDQTNYITSGDITADSNGIVSSLSGDSSNLNSITNLHNIITGDDGTNSSAYGIRVTGDYNQVINDNVGTILTTGSSGRGISISEYSTVTNNGTITTEGRTAYGIYGGGDENNIVNNGNITTSNSSAYGLYINGHNNILTNNGNVTTQVYGIYSNGNANYVTNSGNVITTSGSSAYGIYLYAGSDLDASATNYSTVNNSGIINSATAHGIYARDDYANIINSGTISSGDGSSDYGIRSNANYAIINNSGTITSTKHAIYNGGIGSVITNSGTLNGGVYIGDGTLYITGGTISGEIDGDSLGNLIISGDFTPSADFTDLLSLNIDSQATLIANNNITSNIVTIDQDSTLTISDNAIINSDIEGLSNEVGNLNIAATDFSTDYAIGNDNYALQNLDINDNATLTISNNIYAANTIINGTLNFNGANNLTIFGNVLTNNSGIIDIGQNSQIIDGNLTINDGDNLNLTINGATIGNITTSGAVTISQNSNLNITTTANQDYIDDGTQYVIINANSTSNISEINSNNINADNSGSNISNLLQFSTSVEDNSLILNIDRLEASQVTSNRNSQNIYTNLNKIGSNATGNLAQFQQYLDNNQFDENQITQTLNQLAPQLTKASLSIMTNNANDIIEIFEENFYNSNNNQNNQAWIKTLGRATTQDQIKDDDGYNANSLGVVIGTNYQLAHDNLMALSLGYARSQVKSLDDSKNNLINSTQISLYNSQIFEKYFINSTLAFAWNFFSSNRTISATNNNSTARYQGQSYLAKIAAGYHKNFGNGFRLSPELSFNFIHNKIANYSENGSEELDLEVESIAANNFEVRIGTNFEFKTKVRELTEEFSAIDKVSANLNLSYGRNFINNNLSRTANFVDQDLKFESKISNFDTDSFKAKLSFNIYTFEQSTISTNYKLEHKPSARSHSLSLNIKQKF